MIQKIIAFFKREPKIQFGKVYYDVEVNRFLQPRHMDGELIVCGDYTEFYSDAMTTRGEIPYTAEYFKRMILVESPASFEFAEFYAPISAWRVSKKRDAVEGTWEKQA